MICQIRPSTRCSLPSMRSVGPMLTTLQPIALADEMTMLLFSVIWKLLSAFAPPLACGVCGCDGIRRCVLLVGLLSTLSSMVSGTESLMSLHRIRPSVGCA